MIEIPLDELDLFPALDDGRYYIYVLQNTPDNHYKIGRTTNLKQRVQSLSGSNGGGNHIARCFCSPPTYLYSLETLGHNHFAYARIPNTEWFSNDKVTLQEILDYYEQLFRHPSYEKANRLRFHYNSRLLQIQEENDALLEEEEEQHLAMYR